MRALIVHPGDDRGVRPRAALAAARALAAAGWTVGIGSRERDFVSASRSSRHWHRISPSWESVDAFLDGTRVAVAERGYDLVFGTNDPDVLTLSSHRDELGALVPHPPHERLLKAIDKLHLAAAAERVGLQTPRTVENDPSAREVVVKPRISRVSGEAMVLSDRRTAAQRVAELGTEVVVQERVRGSLIALVVVADRDSRIVARVQQKAQAIFPSDAGVSARAETVAIDESLAERVGQLLRELGWFGLAELQFLIPEGGAPVLIDFNGRFYGSLALGIAAGVNLPAIWAGVATGRTPTRTPEASVGVRYQWLEGDLRRARAEREDGLAWEVADCLRYFPGAAHPIWNASDPIPAIRLFRSILRGSLGFRLRALRQSVGSQPSGR